MNYKCSPTIGTQNPIRNPKLEAAAQRAAAERSRSWFGASIADANGPFFPVPPDNSTHPDRVDDHAMDSNEPPSVVISKQGDECNLTD